MFTGIPDLTSNWRSIRKAGKKGAIAAKEADEIINRLIQGCVSTDEIGVMTKNGEYRIKKCTKYDLGCGYSLITVLDGGCVFVTYIGTHDECNLWLEKNKFLQPRADKSRGRVSWFKNRQQEVLFLSKRQDVNGRSSHSSNRSKKDIFGNFQRTV